MIVTIDGPAGAGKSTASRMLAKRLGFQFLDTGAMYRAVTLAAITRKVDLDDPEALAQVAREVEIRFVDGDVLLDGFTVTQAIRSEDVTENVGAIADTPEVREHLVELQRRIASKGNFVCEGRDQGTVVFPESPCKFFLTASAEERAKRRVDQLHESGHSADFDATVRQQNERDDRDMSRPVGRLLKADDAIEVNTDHKTLGEVVDHLEQIVLSRIVRR
ncbi:MAG: (d)CMP kinase [Planctomycetota bacterium]